MCQISQPHYATASSFSETQISSPFEPRQRDPVAFSNRRFHRIFKPALTPLLLVHLLNLLFHDANVRSVYGPFGLASAGCKLRCGVRRYRRRSGRTEGDPLLRLALSLTASHSY